MLCDAGARLCSKLFSFFFDFFEPFTVRLRCLQPQSSAPLGNGVLHYPTVQYGGLRVSSVIVSFLASVIILRHRQLSLCASNPFLSWHMKQQKFTFHQF